MRSTPALLLLCAAPALAQSSGFQPGELIFFSPAIPSMPTTTAGILRVDPTTGATSILLDPWSVYGSADNVAFDPFRERLIFYGRMDTWDDDEVHLLDGFGNTTSLGYGDTDALGFAPASGGRVYWIDSNKGEIRYLDANDVGHTLLDETGAAVFKAPASAYRCMHYDVGSNSLLVGVDAWGHWNCGTQEPNSQVLRLPLSPDGSQLAGPWSCVQAVVDPSTGSSPVGLTRGPGGQVAITVNTGANVSSPRMGLVDPEAMTWNAYAWNDYFGSSATNAGTWSEALGRFVIFDAYNNVLRTFGAGEVGVGTVINTSMAISGSGSSEIASLVEIPPAGCGPLVDTYCTAKVTSSGCVPAIVTSGNPSLSAPNGFVITATQVEAQQFGLFFYGLNGPDDAPFFGGTLCVNGPLVRTPVTTTGGAGPCGGELTFDFNAWMAGGNDPLITPGAVVHGQFWFRDPAHPVAGVGVTDAVTFTVCN